MALPAGVTYVTNIKGDKGDTGSIAYAEAETIPWTESPKVDMIGPESNRGAKFQIPLPMPGPELLQVRDDAVAAATRVEGIEGAQDGAYAALIEDENSQTRQALDGYLVHSGNVRQVRYTNDLHENAVEGEALFRIQPPRRAIEDFESTALGEQPEGWTQRWAGGEWRVTDASWATGGKALLIEASGGASPNFFGLSWDYLTDMMYGLLECELLMKWRHWSIAYPPRVAMLASGNESSRTAVTSGPVNQTNTGLPELFNNEMFWNSITPTVPMPEPLETTTDYFTKMRRQGVMFQVKTWPVGASEPSWQAAGIGSSITEGDWYGIVANSPSGVVARMFVDWVSFATAGLTAEVR